MATLLHAEHISKEFPGVKALDDVNIKVESGKVLGLLGENGAGKSTLFNVISGVFEPTSGKVSLEGKEVHFRGPKDAQEQGVTIVHQELKLLPNMTVAENIFIGRQPKNKFGKIDYKQLRKQAKELIDRFGFELNPDDMVSDIPIAAQQMVEIAKAVSYGGKVILLDEATSSLTAEETEKLFKIMETLRDEGVGLVFISHKLEEIFRFCDDVLVIRDGQDMGTQPVKGVTEDQLIQLMVGREIGDRFPPKTNTPGDVILEAQHLNRGDRVKDASFTLRRGEVLGIAGLVGAGRSELVRIIFGADKPESGKILIDGVEVKINSPADAIDQGIFLVPEDRKNQGLVLNMDIEKNVALASTKVNSGFLGHMNARAEKEITDESMKQLEIKAYGPEQIVKTLSGGNQQKVVLGKCIMTRPRIMILDDPTRGIDVGTKHEIYELINKFTNEGMAVIMISSELPEVIAMSDRVMVIEGGEIKAILDEDDLTQETIMSYSVGS